MDAQQYKFPNTLQTVKMNKFMVCYSSIEHFLKPNFCLDPIR